MVNKFFKIGVARSDDKKILKRMMNTKLLPPDLFVKNLWPFCLLPNYFHWIVSSNRIDIKYNYILSEFTFFVNFVRFNTRLRRSRGVQRMLPSHCPMKKGVFKALFCGVGGIGLEPTLKNTLLRLERFLGKFFIYLKPKIWKII